MNLRTKNSSSLLLTVMEDDWDRLADSDSEDGSAGDVAGSYPSYSMSPMECLLIFLLFLFWFYALRRFYVVWSNVLNFSAIQSDSLYHGRGWDAFFQWAMEHFRSIRHTRPAGETSCQQRSSVVKSNSISCSQAGVEETRERVLEVVAMKDSSAAVTTTTSGGKMTSEV